MERVLTSVEDARRVRSFLVERNATAEPGETWLLRTWDASCAAWGGAVPEGCRVEHTRLWTDEAGRPHTVLLLLGDGEELVPVVDPAHRDLEAAAIACGEREARAAGLHRVRVLCWEEDEPRARLLAASGYAPTGEGSCFHRRRLPGSALPAGEPPAGYRIRATGAEDAAALASLLNEAFGRSTHEAAHLRAFRASAPCFVGVLDLLVETPGGAPVAYVGIVWDETNRRALCEPVCTHSAHRRRGLARALLLEGMRRAQGFGAKSVDVEAGAENPANALYAALGFEERHRARVWKKTLTR